MLEILIGYIIVATSIGITSYIMLFTKIIRLYEEVIEKRSIYNHWITKLLFIVMATVAAPYFMIVLLSNNNDEFIRSFTVGLLEKTIEEDDD